MVESQTILLLMGLRKNKENDNGKKNPKKTRGHKLQLMVKEGSIKRRKKPLTSELAPGNWKIVLGEETKNCSLLLAGHIHRRVCQHHFHLLQHQCQHSYLFF